jgi:hypothetical protein
MMTRIDGKRMVSNGDWANVKMTYEDEAIAESSLGPSPC